MKTILVGAVLLSAAACYVGRHAANEADKHVSHAAYVPPSGTDDPKLPPPGAVLETVTDLDDNPFSHRDGGVLVPKDPERRASLETADAYTQMSRFAYTLAWLIPLIPVGGLLLSRARRWRIHRLEQETQTQGTSHEILPCITDPLGADRDGAAGTAVHQAAVDIAGDRAHRGGDGDEEGLPTDGLRDGEVG